MKGLAPGASAIIDGISQLDCIKPYLLVGGTIGNARKGIYPRT